MSEPVIIGDATLYHGDALDILPGLRGVASCVVSDVPYLLTSGGCSRALKGCLSVDEGYSNDGRIIPCDLAFDDFMPLVFAACGEDADAYFMADARNIGNLMAAALRVGFEHHNVLVWDKCSVTPNRWYMKGCEFVAYVFKGRARAINDPSAAQILRCPNPVGVKVHPTQKPVALMAEYIRQSTQPGDVVLDPFMGSGTTGVAAIQAGRKFIGIELGAGFFRDAVARISGARRQGGLGIDAPPKKQAGLFEGDAA